MLKQINFNVKIDKDKYKVLKDELEGKLGVLQRKIKDLKIPVMILFEGWDAAGKGTLIDDLMLPLDPRSFSVNCMKEPNYEEINRPFLWRYWETIPEKGRLSIFDQAYYQDLFNKDILKKNQREKMIPEINDFEKTLSNDGTVIIKFFIHISKKEQKRRMKKLLDDPVTAWRVTKTDLKENKNYDRLLEKLETILLQTDTFAGPWTIIEGEVRHYALIKIYQVIVKRLEKAVQKAENSVKPIYKPLITENDDPLRTKILEHVQTNQEMDKITYHKERKLCQKRLRELEYEIYQKRIPVVLAFEGYDAGGKGGAIKRVCKNLDPRGYQVHPTAAPTTEELNHNYLWRFYKNIPKCGHVEIFDRTWYGRLMVEPIEGFCTQVEYDRAFSEINAFERQLTDFGAIVLKFWMQISYDEQERRFKEREANPEKQWKITDEDWRNREKWGAYSVAVDRMILKTSTEKAPWIIVEGDNKYYARIKVLKAIISAIENKIKEQNC